MDLDAVNFAIRVGGALFVLHLIGIAEGLLLAHWITNRKRTPKR